MKKMFSFGLVILVLIGIVYGFKKINKSSPKLEMYMAMGDALLVATSYGENVYKELEDVNEFNDIVKRSNLDSNSLLRFIEVKATIVKGNNSEKISNLIGKSKYITIQVGLNDLNSNVRFNKVEQKFYYDVEVVERICANLQENIYNIVNEIREINKDVKVLVIGYYLPFSSLDDNEKAIGLELYGELNSSLRLGAYDSGAVFVDISDLSNEMYLVDGFLNEEGKKKLVSLIVASCKQK